MSDLKTKINTAYEAIKLLSDLNLPISREQKETISSLEQEYISSTIIPDIQEIVQGNVFDNLRPFELTVSFSKDTGVKVYMNNKAREMTANTTIPKPSRKHDTTKFSIDGTNYYNKKQFVYHVISQYIKDNPSITFAELERVFPSEIYGKTNGVVRKWSEVQNRILSQPDLINRYFTESDKRITLMDGTVLVVNNQWGPRFPNFLVVAKRLYQVTSNVPFPGV